MDSIVDSIQNAYKDFRAASDEVLKSKEQSGGLKSTALDAALENFRQKGELLLVACDQTQEFVDSMRRRIGLECLVDEATGSIKPAGTTSLPPISAVRLEQMSKAVRWLVIELQKGSGGAAGASGHTHHSAPFDASCERNRLFRPPDQKGAGQKKYLSRALSKACEAQN